MIKQNKIITILIIIVNLYFLPLSIYILYKDGGPMGIGYMILPFSIIINLFLIPAILAFKKNPQDK
jgi:hypothetical protein